MFPDMFRQQVNREAASYREIYPIAARCGVFDTWYQQLQRGNYISVRNFEDYLRTVSYTHLLPPVPGRKRGMQGRGRAGLLL